MEKYYQAWENIGKLGKILESVGKYLKAWGNIGKRGEIFESMGIFKNFVVRRHVPPPDTQG